MKIGTLRTARNILAVPFGILVMSALCEIDISGNALLVYLGISFFVVVAFLAACAMVFNHKDYKGD